ncbi:hypothetical protein AMS68_002458 [Peltaster fructicola]|uniref:Uncharacterized protein n=1 Tax=Peltaster fructicola TaxID=286661 RepID=A0A6H0XQL3_9PEZI|nr:hypothetical protein AMS68_002458 [Peltaster fructicola]
MLAQSLARRIHRHNVWHHNYQQYLSRTTTASYASQRHVGKHRAKSGRIESPEREVRGQAASLPPAPKYAPAPQIDEREQQIIEAKKLLGEHDEIILYKSTGHGSLMVWSLLGGTTFSTMAFNTAAGIMTGGPFSIWLQVPTLGGCALALGMGFTMYMTTTRTIQDVRLVCTPDKQYKLRFDTKWRAYFWEPKRFEVALNRIATDRAIRDIDTAMYTVDIKDRFEWTEFEDKQSSAFRLDRTLRSFKEGLMNGWSLLKRDVGRMFVRHGMMIVRIDDKNWKMDMWHATMLDKGVPLAQLVKEDKDIKNSLAGIIRRSFGS